MWQLLTALPSLLKGFFGSVDNITNAIANEKIAARNAQTEEERIASSERVKSLEMRRDLMVTEASVSRANIYVRTAAAVPTVIVIWKLMVWDKVVGSFAGCSGAPYGTCKIFTTDPFDDNQWKIIMMVMGFYFLYEISMGVTSRFRKS